MVTEFPGNRSGTPGRSRPRADGAWSGGATDLPYTWPPAGGRVGVWVVRLVLLPVFVAIPYGFANYPVDRFLLHTEGRVVDGWVAAAVSVALCCFMLVSDGSSVRADSVRLSIRAQGRQHDYSWGDVAAIGHTEHGLVVTDRQGRSATVRLVERSWQSRLVRRTSPMAKVAADLERIRLHVRAPENLTRQVRVGAVRLTAAEWTYAILVTLGALGVATLRTLGS